MIGDMSWMSAFTVILMHSVESWGGYGYAAAMDGAHGLAYRLVIEIYYLI